MTKRNEIQPQETDDKVQKETTAIKDSTDSRPGI